MREPGPTKPAQNRDGLSYVLPPAPGVPAHCCAPLTLKMTVAGKSSMVVGELPTIRGSTPEAP